MDANITEDKKNKGLEKEADSATKISVKNGVGRLFKKHKGVIHAKAGEMLLFEEANIKGMVLNLETTLVGAIILGDDSQVMQDQTVIALDELVTTNVGEELLGRVVNGLGEAIDGLAPLYQKTI